MLTIKRVVLTGVLAALAGAQAWAAIPIATCGFTISAPGNYVVTTDLMCTGLGEDGIDITASNVSVNLNGHIITGPAAAHAGFGIFVNPAVGPRLNHVGISGPGVIQGFTTGIYIQSSDYAQVTQTTLAGNAVVGMLATNITYLTVGGNVIGGNEGNTGGPGLLLNQSTAAQVNGNQVVGNKANGIVLQSGDSNEITGNVASGNGGSGILLGPDTAAFPLTNSRVSSNTTNVNGASGIQVLNLTPAASGNEIFSNTQSVGNTVWDLEDDNLVPPCGTDFWSGNVHFTANQACVK